VIVSTRRSPPWIPIEKIELFVQPEPALVILGLAFTAWLISRVFLRKLSAERQRNLKAQFSNLGIHLLFGNALFVTYYLLEQLPYTSPALERFMTYIGFGAILSGATIFVKAWRILVFQYLLISHMRVAFPVLLVNLFTLMLSMILGAWISAEIFNIRLTPILATSAILSLVLGLAVQDTLGNLFAGVALQFDKPYEIGDWIEIQTNGQKWVGQVQEISWRATVLLGFTDETITVPNRIISQAQISNFSTKYRPIIRSQIFRLPFGVSVDHVKAVLLGAAKTVPTIRTLPAPFVFISETTESWISFKLIYFIDNYGDQFSIADHIYSKVLPTLREAGYDLAGHQIRLKQPHENLT
jgi:small-conductance mechanosensitive channel